MTLRMFQYMSRADLLLPLMTDDIKNNDSLFDKKRFCW